jgi:P-type Ca2+ transporter type 2C
MILVLVIAAVISLFIGELTDTIIILIIIVLNSIIGFIQEYRAEKSMEALRKMTEPSAAVVRDGRNVDIPVAELVPGDIVLLEAGNIVPADIRVLKSKSLKIDESALTGESVAVDKTTEPLKEDDLPLGDRYNMVFKGTNVSSGSGKGIVVDTGMKTELGKIAGMLEKVESKTPLQKRLTDFSKKLTIVVIVLCIGLFTIGYLRGEEVSNMLLTSISLAVAAIPEALPAVVTISLALGANRLIKRKVLIRKLYAVETLGSVTYICTDKTGTLTKNEMQVKEVWTLDEGKEELMLAMSLNHTAKEKDGKLTGDPTELAMIKYAEKQEVHKKVKEIPFEAERKAMTTIHQMEKGYWSITKGAPEKIASIAGNNLEKEIEEQEKRMAGNGMRVIGFAGKPLNELPKEIKADDIEKDLAFIGLVGLIDPPREEAKDAIHQCKQAGIVPVMITGDHPLTGVAIAKEIGIIDKEDQKAMTGKEVEEKGEEGLKSEAGKVRVFARVSPEQKLKIVGALQQKGEFVAMTGDGVNDAPSLKKANIGIAMGVTGTDVAKETAHMILMDDNFATIVGAVKEGRRIYDNIRKFIKYILTGNTAEILTIFLAPLVGLPIPLLPVHILWINLVTDGLPALALAAERSEKDIMKRPPRPANEGILAQGLGIHVLWAGFFISILSIGTQWVAMEKTGSHWQTMVFSVLCFSQLWHVLAIRRETTSFFRTSIINNKSMLAAISVTMLLQLAIIYLPFLNVFFHTEPLSVVELLSCIGISFLIVVAVEIDKLIKKKR